MIRSLRISWVAMFVATGRQFFDEKNDSTWNLSCGDGNTKNLTALADSYTNATLTTTVTDLFTVFD